MLCENFWWPFGVFLWEHFRPYLAPRSPIFFCLILPEFCDFSGVLYLRYLIFLRMRFLQKFWVLATFLVFWWFSNSFGTLGPKMDKTYNFWVRSIWSKIQNFEGFSKHCALLETTSGQNLREIEETPRNPKRGHLMDAESIRKTLKFSISIQLLYWRNLPQIIYLNKIFHSAKSWSVTQRL